jgi:hypothetical protein
MMFVVSELWLTTGLLLICKVMHEYGEPWWNNIYRRNPDSPTRALWQSHQESHIVANQEERIKKIILRRYILHPVKYYYMGLTALLPLRRKACCELLSPLKFIVSAGYEPANVWSNGRHAYHYTTEVA